MIREAQTGGVSLVSWVLYGIGSSDGGGVLFLGAAGGLEGMAVED